MQKLKLYFSKEQIIEDVVTSAFTDGNIQAKKLDELACVLRLSDRLNLNKKDKKAVCAMYKRDNQIKVGDDWRRVEFTGVFDYMRQSVLKQLKNKTFSTSPSFNHVLVGYDVDASDTGMVMALRDMGVIR